MSRSHISSLFKMVKLVIKKGDEAQFLYETTVETNVEDVIADVSAIYNGRLKVQRICAGISRFHGNKNSCLLCQVSWYSYHSAFK